jgi:FkbM family methyltransferase
MLPFKQQVATAARKLPLPWAVKRHLRFAGIVNVRIDATHEFRVHTAGPIERNLFFRGFGGGWEATSIRLWATLAPSAQTILDVGANVGIYALTARAVNPSAQILAFEPSERIFQKLSANIELNGYAMLAEKLAVSAQDGSASLYDYEREVFYAATLEVPEPGDRRSVMRTVTTVRLDSYCAERGIDSVDLMKLDIEGHEPAALEGMGALLESSKPTMLIEVLSSSAADALTRRLSPLGYRYYRIFEGRGIWPVDRFEAHDGPDRNYLVVQSDAVDSASLSDYLLAAAPAS